jgi:hypothetical protein
MQDCPRAAVVSPDERVYDAEQQRGARRRGPDDRYLAHHTRRVLEHIDQALAHARHTSRDCNSSLYYSSDLHACRRRRYLDTVIVMRKSARPHSLTFH